MLPFTQERLVIANSDIFYYNRQCLIPEIYKFSRQIHEDLGNYLGIEFEINQRLKFSGVVPQDGKSGFYDNNKIYRIATLYDFYVDCILKTIQLLYYDKINESKLYTFCSTTTGKLQELFIPDLDNQELQNVNQAQIYNAMTQDGTTKKDSQAFLLYFNKMTSRSGVRLSDCFKKALEKCQPFKTMIDQQINLEFPIDTLSDRVVQKEKIVVSKKKK